MSGGDFLRYRGLLTVAVGAGVMIGAAGMFLYHHLFGERRRLLLQQDICQLGLSVAEIRKELDAIRALKAKPRRSHRNTSATSVVTDSETDLFSAVGADELDDEFFDFSSDENTLELQEDEGKMNEFAEIDELLNGDAHQKTKAYGILLEMYEKNDRTPDLLWRLAKACHMMATVYGEEGDIAKKQELITAGVNYAQDALQLDSSNANAHKWFAVCVGARGQFQGVKEKIRDGFVFKEHVEAAIVINPQDPTLHHLLGRFKYEVATLSWLERKVAGTLFGDIPEASYADVVSSLLEAENLNPTPWKENKLLLAKCYVNQGDYKQALQWLDKAAEVPVVTPEDRAAQKDIESLLKKYSSYSQPK